MNSEDDYTAKVFNALSSGNYRWRTIAGVSRDVGIDEANVANIISENSGLIVRSSIPSKNGEPLFSTRENLLKSATFSEKLLGAFKNRLL